MADTSSYYDFFLNQILFPKMIMIDTPGRLESYHA